MAQYSYVIGGVLLFLASALAIYLARARRVSAPPKRSFLDYLLLWPIILEADQDKRGGKFLTGREWVGWLAVVLLIVGAILFA
jgi:hypothetical protein